METRHEVTFGANTVRLDMHKAGGARPRPVKYPGARWLESDSQEMGRRVKAGELRGRILA
jgi:hypothetical protein